MENNKEFNVKMRKRWKWFEYYGVHGTVPGCPRNHSWESMEPFQHVHGTVPGCPLKCSGFSMARLFQSIPGKLSEYSWEIPWILVRVPGKATAG